MNLIFSVLAYFVLYKLVSAMIITCTIVFNCEVSFSVGHVVSIYFECLLYGWSCLGVLDSKIQKDRYGRNKTDHSPIDQFEDFIMSYKEETVGKDNRILNEHVNSINKSLRAIEKIFINKVSRDTVKSLLKNDDFVKFFKRAWGYSEEEYQKAMESRHAHPKVNFELDKLINLISFNVNNYRKPRRVVDIVNKSIASINTLEQIMEGKSYDSVAEDILLILSKLYDIMEKMKQEQKSIEDQQEKDRIKKVENHYKPKLKEMANVLDSISMDFDLEKE